MKFLGATILGFLFSVAIFAQSAKINGKITNEKGEPLASANIYIEGTIDGGTSEEDGTFSFETSFTSGQQKLVATAIGYKKLVLEKFVNDLQNLNLRMLVDPNTLKEVEIVAGSFQVKGSGNIESKNAVDLVTVAGSEGDMYKSLSVLPGAQSSGVDGQLQVRGGTSVESQTFIDDMHVMSPYTARPENTSVRGRFSPFIFDRITFSMGGFSPEYSQSLSSVQPLQTKDESGISKTGISLMTTGASIGGTQAWKKSSTSFEVGHTNMQPYYWLLYPSQRDDWKKYYRETSLSNQTRFKVGEKGVLKSFVSYQKTVFEKNMIDFATDEKRTLDFAEDNLYLNTTFRNRFTDGTRLFIGAAYALNKREIGDASVAGDNYYGKQDEIHIKAKVEKRFSYLYKLGMGVENYFRTYDLKYQLDDVVDRQVRYAVTGAYLTNDFNLSENLIFNASGRVEYSENDHKWAILPRFGLNYQWRDFTFSAAAARYQQSAENDYMIYNEKLNSEKATQYVLSAQNSMSKYTFLRVEAYYKKYDNLLTGEKYAYFSDGFGHSRGVDFLLKSGFQTRKNQSFEYMISFSFNDSKRKYLQYQSAVVPPFVTKNNASLVLKYTNMNLKSIFGVTNQYASGRTYNDPNLPGEMNAKTPGFHTLDFCWTYLANEKLIIYASSSNILNRNNIYGYTFKTTKDVAAEYSRSPITPINGQFFFIGCFFTLSGKTAYDASRF
jgi:hypothetical protein